MFGSFLANNENTVNREIANFDWEDHDLKINLPKMLAVVSASDVATRDMLTF